MECFRLFCICGVQRPTESFVLRDTDHNLFFLINHLKNKLSVLPFKKKGQQSKRGVEIPILSVLSEQKPVVEGMSKQLTWPQY